MTSIAPEPTSPQSEKFWTKPGYNKSAHPRNNKDRNSNARKGNNNSTSTTEDTNTTAADRSSSLEREGGEQQTATTLSDSTSSSDAALLQSITSKQSVLLQPTVTITMYIPTSFVGAVIGRRGQNICNLQKLAATKASTKQPVRVSVIGQPHDANNTENTSFPYTYSELDFSNPNHWTPVVIRADPRAAFTAAQKLEETCQSKMDQDVVVDVPLGRNKHASVVGKRGLTLANLSADTNVRIMVPNNPNKQHGGGGGGGHNINDNVIQLEGSLANVMQCLDRVLQVVVASSSSAAAGAGGGTLSSGNTTGNKGNKTSGAAAAASPLLSSKQQSEAASAALSPERLSQTMVLRHLPSQTKLRSIGRKTDTSIKKRKMTSNNDSNTSGCWQLTLTGTSQEQIQSAVNILQKWYNDYNNNNNSSSASATLNAAAATTSENTTPETDTTTAETDGADATAAPGTIQQEEEQPQSQQQQQQQQSQQPQHRRRSKRGTGSRTNNNKRWTGKPKGGGGGGGSGDGPSSS